MEDKIPKKYKSKFQELVKPIISLERPRKEDLEPSEYIDLACHTTPGDSTTGKYRVKIRRFDFGTSEEWIIFVDLDQNASVRQNVTTVSPMYECIERGLKGQINIEFTQQANLVGSCTIGNFTIVTATMTVHIFPALAYHDQKRICIGT